MLQRLRRQRRRLGLCFLAGAAAGALAAGAATPLQAVALGAAGGVVAAVQAAIVVVLAPGWRWAALKVPLVAALAALAARLGAPPGGVALGAALATPFLPSQPAFLDAVRVPFMTRARVRRRLAVPASAAWAALRPRPGGAYWDPQVAMVRAGPAPDVLVLVQRPLGTGRGAELPVRVFDLQEGRHFKARDLSLPPADRGGPVTVTSLTVEPDGDGARLVLIEASWRQGLWTAFALWLDDYLGDHVDRMAALLEGRPDRSLRGAVLRAAAAAQARRGRKPTRS